MTCNASSDLSYYHLPRSDELISTGDGKGPHVYVSEVTMTRFPLKRECIVFIVRLQRRHTKQFGCIVIYGCKCFKSYNLMKLHDFKHYEIDIRCLDALKYFFH